jgi:hypothetical protein
MAGLLAWVGGGGVLATVSGAGGCDEYDEPSLALKRATRLAPAPRDRWYLQGEQACVPPTGGPAPCDTYRGVATLPGAGAAPFRAYGLRDAVGQPPPEVEAAARFEDGTAAVLVTAVGAGSAVHYPWLPGVSYAYSRQNGSAAAETAGLRAVLVNLTRRSGVRPLVVVSTPEVEAMLLLTNRSDRQAGSGRAAGGPGAVVALVNWRCVSDDCGLAAGGAVGRLGVRARLPFAPRSAFSTAQGRPLEL